MELQQTMFDYDSLEIETREFVKSKRAIHQSPNIPNHLGEWA